MISVGGLALAYIKFIRDQEKRISSLEERSKDFVEMGHKIDALVSSDKNEAERLKALEVKMELFWQAVQTSVISMLKHPTAKRKDELLDKLGDQSITVKELPELKELLKCDVVSKKKDALAAALVIARIDMLLYDHKALTIGK